MTEHAVPWDRVEAALDQALDLEAAARAAFVEDLARDDPELAGELRSMLEVAEDTGGLLDTDVVALLGADFLSTVSGDSRPGDAVGRNIGPYRIEAEIGHGGMGRVFLARRDDGEFDQEVALKLLRWEVPGEALVQRFRSERQVLAGLHHPGIARLLDGGVTPEGLPYLVMERIEGLPIDDHCRTMTLGLRDRVSLVRDVCGAVQFAHSRLIVHRDVKPSNILVTHGGRTKLLDFGLAKLLDDSDGSVTQAGGGAPLTPNYAAPEQIEGGAIGAAADVYALGVLLFELLTGQRPHEQGSPTTAELARRVVAEDPPLASSVVAPDERSWASRDLAGDLDAILAKALRREPDRRYSSAEQLAEDLDRYLSFQPIRARRVTPGYRLARFVRRNRGPVAAAVTFVVALSAALGLALAQARRAGQEAERAREEADRAAKVSGLVGGLLELADPFTSARGGSLGVRQLLEQGLAEAEASLSDDPLSLASVLGVIGTGFARIGLYDEGRGLLDRAVTLLEPLDEADVVVDVLKRTGDLEKARNRSEAADTAYQAALALQREDHGVGSVLEGKILGALADAAVSARGAEAAEAYHTAAMDIFTTQLEAGDPQLALQRTVGARILTAQGRLEEAEREYVDVMSQQRNESGLSSGQLTVTLNNLAFVRSRMGNNAGAADSYRESLSLLESTVGASHPSTIRVRSNLSATLGRMGDMAGAEALLIDNVDAVRAESPADTTGIAGALRTLGGAYLFWGEFEKGVQVFEELLEIGVRSPGATAVVLMLDRLKLAMALTLAGRRDEGRALRESTLAALPGIGPLNSAAMGQLSWIAGRYEANGEPDLAALHREYAVPPTGARRP